MSNAIERIVSSKRLPVLFLGAGISRRYLDNYPTWSQLLDLLRAKLGISKTAYAAKLHEIKSNEPAITNGKLNQKMASYLQEKMYEKIEKDELDLPSILSNEEIDGCVERGTDFFKQLVAKQFLEYTVKEEKREELKKLQMVGNKASMVFTTNYDCFIQNEVFPEFKVYDRQDKYYFRTSNGYGELFKIHGSSSSPNGIIICEKDYETFDSSLKLISSKLLNALMDFPVIFLGYSLEDENIKKIITDFVNCFDEKILQEIKKYMVMIVYEEGQNELIEGEKQFTDSESGKSITLTTIKTDNFGLIYDKINSLSPSATTYELRKYKTMVADLITRAAKGEKTVYVQELDDAKADAQALYIGSKNSIEGFSKSTIIYENKDIMKKSLYNEPYDYDSFALEWFDSKCIKEIEYTPAFYILSRITIPYESCGTKFKKNVEGRRQFFDDCIQKHKNTVNYSNKAALLDRYEYLKNEGRKSLFASICPEVEIALACNSITIEDAKAMLLKIYEDNNVAISDSSFKRCACFIWYLEYKKSTEG